MLAQEVVDYNAMHDLIVALLELYESNKSLWKERSGRTHSSIQSRSMPCWPRNPTKRISNTSREYLGI